MNEILFFEDIIFDASNPLTYPIFLMKVIDKNNGFNKDELIGYNHFSVIN